MNASERITNSINELADWRGTMLARLRTVILEAAPGIVEEWKWDVPVWSYNGNVVSAAAFQAHVKINFFKGASLHDPHGLLNAGLEAKQSRAIDIHEGDEINTEALKDLIRAAIALNGAKPKSKRPPTRK